MGRSWGSHAGAVAADIGEMNSSSLFYAWIPSLCPSPLEGEGTSTREVSEAL
jgi:hypothetical protein